MGVSGVVPVFLAILVWFAVVAPICGGLWQQLPAVSQGGRVLRLHTLRCVFVGRFAQCEQAESSVSLQCSSGRAAGSSQVECWFQHLQRGVLAVFCWRFAQWRAGWPLLLVVVAQWQCCWRVSSFWHVLVAVLCDSAALLC